MDALINLARGVCRVRAYGASPERLLNILAENDVLFWDAVPEDEFTVLISVHRRNIEKLEILARKAMCAAEVVERRGLPYFARRFRKRYTLLLGLGVCVFALLCSSLFIWDIRVVGNKEVSTAEILEALEGAGIGIGSYWPAFTSERIRNKVLLKIPELLFITVNVYGSRAEVIVRERIQRPEIVDEGIAADVYADKSGIISSMSVLRGSRQSAPGKTVLKGDLLVKGEFVDLNQRLRQVRAMADVSIKTWHELVAAAESEILQKEYTGKVFSKTALVVGNIRINFYINGGNPDMFCDKIVREIPVALEDAFILPLTLIREYYAEYEPLTVTEPLETVQRRLEIELMDRLIARIGDEGRIVSSSYSYSERDGLIFVTLRAECLEKTGETRPIK